MFFICVGQLNLQRQTWVSQPAAVCSVSACPKPDEVPFSMVVPLKQSYEPGEQIVFSCQPGYVSRGGIRRFTCPLTGLWPINTLKCMRESASFRTLSAHSDPAPGGEMTDLVQLRLQKARSCGAGGRGETQGLWRWRWVSWEERLRTVSAVCWEPGGEGSRG